MANYLKGTNTYVYLRLMNEDYGVVITDDLKVYSIDSSYDVRDKDGSLATWTSVTGADRLDYVFLNPAQLSWATNPLLEPMGEITDMSPDLAEAWDEFDKIGSTVKQLIPIRKEFAFSVTYKASDGYWDVSLFGDVDGNYAHHGVHTDGTTPKLTCFEGKNEIGSDIGYQANIVLGKQENGTWLVMRVMNICIHSCSNEITPAAITNKTIEFSGNHGYLYQVADPFLASNLVWDPAIGAHQ